MAQKVCPRLRDSASWSLGRVHATQGKLFDLSCTISSSPVSHFVVPSKVYFHELQSRGVLFFCFSEAAPIDAFSIAMSMEEADYLSQRMDDAMAPREVFRFPHLEDKTESGEALVMVLW